MSFPITEQQCNYVISKRFGLRSAKDTADLKGAAYALDEGQQYMISSDYMQWDYHLSNSLWVMREWPGAENRKLLFISSAYGTAERYPYSDGVGDKKTFPKCNAINAPTLHASTDLNNVIATLMQWVFDCIDQYGPI